MPSRRGRLALSTIVIAFVGAVGIWLIYRTNTGWAYDTNVYRMGASIVLHGGDLYARSTPQPYTYPPFSALLFIPLAILPADVMAVVWTALSLTAFFVVTRISLKALSFPSPQGGGRSWWGPVLLVATMMFVAVWLDPIADTLLSGQVNLLVMALVLGDLLLPDSNRWKGIATGFAATFKLLPLFFVVYLLATRRTAAALRAITAFFATVLIGFAVLPRDSIIFWSGTFLDSTRVGDAQNPRSESLLSLLVRWTHSTNGVRPLWYVLGVVVAIGILALAVWAHRRGDEFLAICIAAAGTLLLSPITWRHHWVWILPILLWMVSKALPSTLVRIPPQLAGPGARFPPPLAEEGRGMWWLSIPIALIALDFYLRPYGSIPVNAPIDLHLNLMQLLLSSTHAMSLLLFLTSAIAILRGSRQLDSSSTTRRRRQPFREARPTPT